MSQEEKKEPDEPNSPVNFSITSVNHIAFIVSDVGRSSVFYSDVLGLQQVKRPNFDRHGAWFTGGNIEIHLILGNPVTPSRSIKGFEASTIWFEVDDFEKAKNELKILEAAYGEDIQIEVDDDIIRFAMTMDIFLDSKEKGRYHLNEALYVSYCVQFFSQLARSDVENIA